ncbi:hypothetical protein AB4865_11850 [Capnocytophaga sp. ARDL2]|uniref:hypothetical protein n=1 Tax=Capnocytophaga sp. ARDL2 TaxID=3238809 RepID=UPI003558C699
MKPKRTNGVKNISSNDITSLEGIEAFTNITKLIYTNHSISTTVVLGNKPHLKEVILNRYYSPTDGITSFFAIAPQLEFLVLSKNKHTQLDVSNNTNLIYLEYNNNQLTQLNMANGNNNALNFTIVDNNPNLTCIQIDSTLNSYWVKDAHAYWSTDYNYPSLSTDAKNLLMC